MPKKIPSRILLACQPDIQAKEGEETATFTMKAYTGAKMMVGGFFDPVIIDLAGLKSQQKIPILSGHEPDRIVGHSTSITVSAKDVQVEGKISGVGFSAKEVLETAKNGFPWQASVGASVEQAIYVDEGDKVQVNGRSYKGPLVVAQKTILNEVSFVPLGADRKTSAKVAASFDSSSPEIGVLSMEFDAYVKALGLDPENLTDDQRETIQAQLDETEGLRKQVKAAKAAPKRRAKKVEPPTDDEPTDAEKQLQASRESAATEAERVGKINKIAATSEFSTVPKLEEIHAQAIREGWTTDKFELECRRSERPRASQIGVHVQQDENMGEVLECAILMSANLPDKQLQAAFDEKIINAAMQKKYRGAGIHTLMDYNISAAGHSFSGSRKSNDYIEAAFRADMEIRANAGFSTTATSQILESAANKQLVAGYSSAEVTWPMICALHSISDFKPANRYRLDSEGSFRMVPPDGEIKHMALSDDKYTKQLETYGAIIALNRQQIINDDLNAFMDIPRLLGRAAALRLEEAVYTILLDSIGTFFVAGNANITDALLAVAGLNTAEAIFRDQIDGNGKPILVSPQVLLVPSTLKITADDLYANNTVNQVLTGNEIARNPHAGKYPPVTSPYLNNTAITNQDGGAVSANQSDTAWFLFADPNVRAAIAVGLLNGSRTPVLESAQTDFNTLGMQWRAYHDFGVGLEDPKAAVYSSGDAT